MITCIECRPRGEFASVAALHRHWRRIHNADHYCQHCEGGITELEREGQVNRALDEMERRHPATFKRILGERFRERVAEVSRGN